MDMKNCNLDIRDHVMTITIDRPPVNALSRATLEECAQAFDLALKDANIRGIIITGAGDQTFSAGADMAEFGDMVDPEMAERTLQRIHNLFDRIETFPKPVIACVNGKALGGGNELQMACHLAIASDTAQFALPEIKRGIIPGYGGTQRLPRLIGKRRALEWLLTGESLPASRALEYGLVNRVVPHTEVRQSAFEWAKQLASGPPLAMKAILETVTNGLKGNPFDGLQLERENIIKVMRTEDAVEGVSAFFSKRPPQFKGK